MVTRAGSRLRVLSIVGLVAVCLTVDPAVNAASNQTDFPGPAPDPQQPNPSGAAGSNNKEPPLAAPSVVAARISLSDLSWLSKGVSSDDLRKLLDDQTLPNITSLVDLLHRDVPTADELKQVREIWDSVGKDYEAYAAKLTEHYQSKGPIAGEPIVGKDGKLGFILPLDLSSQGEVPMPESLRAAFLEMIQTGRHAGIKALIDAGVIDRNANKLMGKIRNDVHEAVMARLVAEVGHEVHLDNFSIAELIRSDIDQTLGKHVAFTWTDGKRQAVGTDGAKLVELYNSLFSETVSELTNGRFAGIKAQDMEIVCHNADARLPDAALHYDDNAKFTAVLRAGQRKLILNPEAYFLEGAYRAEVERRSFETDQKMHCVYKLHTEPDGRMSVVRDLYTAKDKVFQFLAPELRPAHAADVALGQWVFFRRHMHDSTPTTLMDQSKYPLRVVEEAVPLMSGKDLWTFKGTTGKMSREERRRLLSEAIPAKDLGRMTIEQVERIIDVSSGLREAAKGGNQDVDAILRPFEDAVAERIVANRKKANLPDTSREQVKAELGDSIKELARAEYQAQTEAFMLKAAVAAAPHRIAEYLNPKIDLERLRAIADGRVKASKEAVRRAKKILKSGDEPQMRDRLKGLAEMDLTQIGMILKYEAPEHYKEFIAKFDPQTREHFEWLLFQNDLATFLHQPVAGARGGGHAVGYAGRQAVQAMKAGWNALAERRAFLRDYAASVKMSWADQGGFATAGKVLDDVCKGTADPAKYAKWGGSVVLHNFARDLGFSFGALDDGIKRSAYLQATERPGWGEYRQNVKWSPKEFVKANVGLGQLDSALTVMQAWQEHGWNDETEKVMWNEVYSNIPGIGLYYSTWNNLHLTKENAASLVMQWGPVYAQYAYGEAVAAAASSPLIAFTAFQVTKKTGDMFTYQLFDELSREMFFGSGPEEARHDPGAPLAEPTDLASGSFHQAGLLDIVPGPTLADRKIGLYDWMESYHKGDEQVRPFSVMQSVGTEADLFRKSHGLWLEPNESAEHRARRLKKSAELQPELDALQARSFEEKLGLKSRALAVEFLRGDEIGDDRAFGSMREQIRALHRFWKDKPTTVEHLTKLIEEHYLLGMNKERLLQAAAEDARSLAEANAAWVLDATMKEVHRQGVAEANANRSEAIWAGQATPEEPPELTPEELDRAIRGDIDTLRPLREGDTRIEILKPEGPLQLSSIDSLAILQLAAKVSTPAEKFKRPFRYEWAVGSRSGKKDAESGLSTLTCRSVETGKKIPATVKVFDLLDRPMGEATTEIEIAPSPLRFETLALAQGAAPGKILFEGKDLDTDKSMAGGHDYQLKVQVTAHEPWAGFEDGGAGLVPAAIVERAQKYLDNPPDAGKLDGQFGDIVDRDSAVPVGYQFLWHHLQQRSRGKLTQPTGSAGRLSPQTLTATINLVGERDAADEYYLFAIANGSSHGDGPKAGHHFLLSEKKIILRQAETPGVTWQVATVTEKTDKKEVVTDLLRLDRSRRVIYPVRKPAKAVLTALGSTSGVKPAEFELGFQRMRSISEAEPGSYKPIKATTQELGPGRFACSGECDLTDLEDGLYQIVGRIRIPSPDASFYLAERLEARRGLWPLVEIRPALPKPDVASDLQALASRLKPKKTGKSNPKPPADPDPSASNNGDRDHPGVKKPTVNPGELADLAEQSEIQQVSLKSSLALQRIRRDGKASVGETVFTRSTAAKLLPVVRANALLPGMKVEIEAGYTEGGKACPLLKQALLISAATGNAGRLELDLSGRPELRPLWGGKDVREGPHVAFLHVQVISKTGKYRSKPEKLEIAFTVQDEPPGKVIFHPATICDRLKNSTEAPGTKFWDDAHIIVRVPVEITGVAGPDPIAIRHRFTMTPPKGDPIDLGTEWIEGPGAGPHLLPKGFGSKTPLMMGTWTVRVEILDAKDKNGNALLEAGGQRASQAQFSIVVPKIVFSGPEDGWQGQNTPGDKKGKPVLDFRIPSDQPVARLAFHVVDVPADCILDCSISWWARLSALDPYFSARGPCRPETHFPPVCNPKDGGGQAFWTTYQFQNDEYDENCFVFSQVSMSRKDRSYGASSKYELDKGGIRAPKNPLPLPKPLDLRFRGRQHPESRSSNVTSRDVTCGFRYSGGTDHVININLNGKRALSNVKLSTRSPSTEFRFKIPNGRSDAEITIESVSAQTYDEGARIWWTTLPETEDARASKSWTWDLIFFKPGDKATMQVRYAPKNARPVPATARPIPAPPPPNVKARR